MFWNLHKYFLVFNDSQLVTINYSTVMFFTASKIITKSGIIVSIQKTERRNFKKYFDVFINDAYKEYLLRIIYLQNCFV